MDIQPKKESPKDLQKYIDMEPLAVTDPTEMLPLPTLEEAKTFGTRVADYATMGIGQHAAGLGAGLGAAGEQFMQSDAPLSDRLGQAYERFKSSYSLGRQDYLTEQEAAREALSPSQEFLAGATGSLSTLKFPFLGAANKTDEALVGIQKAKEIAQQTLKAGAVQSGLGFLGSKEENLEKMAWDGVVSGAFGAGFPVAGEVAGRTISITNNLIGALKRGYASVRETMTNVPDNALKQFVKLGPNGIEKWISQHLPEGTPTSEIGQAADNFMKGIKEKLIERKREIGNGYSAAIKARFGNKELPMEIVSEFTRLIDNKIATLKPKVKGHSEAIEELNNLKNILKGKGTGKQAPAIYGPKGEVLVPAGEVTLPPTYEDFYDMYRQAKDQTKINFKYINDPDKASASKEVSRVMADIVGGEKGIQAKARKMAPELEDLDNQFSEFMTAMNEFNTNMIRDKTSKLKYMQKMAKGADDPGKGVRLINEIIPEAKVQEGASNLVAANMLKYSALKPEGFASRSLAGGLLGGLGASFMDPGDTSLDSYLTFGALLATTPASRRLGGDIKRVGNLFTKNPVSQKMIGPTIERLKALGLDTLSSPAATRGIIEGVKENTELDEDLKKRLGQ